MPYLVAKQLTTISGVTLHHFIATSLLITMLLLSMPVLAVDSDHDGVDDKNDRCPNTAQLKKLPANFIYRAAVNPQRLQSGAQAYPVDQYGCEADSDGDGVVNSQDYCPNDSANALAMGIAANGCPKQSDGDGTPDYRDRCPNTPRGSRTDKYGCEITS